MPSSNWRKRFARFIRGEWAGHPLSWWEIGRFALWLTVTGWGFWLLFAAYQGLWSWHHADREIDYQYNQRAQQNREKAAHQIAQRCAVPLAPADIVGMCLVDEIETYRKQAVSDQDLKAQQEMARWTAVMGYVGVIGIPLSMLGLLALWFSLRQTRQAISTDREVGHAQVRAYLTIEPKSPSNLEVGKRPRAELQIKNTGQSPAYNVRYIAAVFIEDHPLPAEGGPLIYPDPDQVPRIGNTIAAQGDFSAEGFGQKPLEKGELQAAMTGSDKRFYLSCIVYYNDVFGVARETMMTAYFEQTSEPVEDPSTGRIGRSYAWMIAHTLNHAT